VPFILVSLISWNGIQNTLRKNPIFIFVFDIYSSSLIQLSTITFKLGFSKAAATLSLSLICLLTGYR
jgi:hypothetical protein